MQIEPGAVANLTLRLVAQRSLSGQEGEVAALVAGEMGRLGFDVGTDALGNIIGSMGSGHPIVLVDSHLDTVGVNDPEAWTYDPAGQRVGNRIYGRGSMDMKGPLAASIHGVASLAGNMERGTVVVSASVAEEMIEGVALEAIAGRVSPDFVVICEPSSLRLARGQRGRAEIVIETRGSATHSSRPELGVNAAEAMLDVAKELRRFQPAVHPVLGSGILVLTDILSQPYPANSVVPNTCLATYDRRTLPGETADSVLGPIREVLASVLASSKAKGEARMAVDDFASYSGARIQATNFAPAWFYGDDAEIVRRSIAGLTGARLDAVLSHYAFATNGSGTAGRLGIPTIGFGPGNEELAHRSDEHIEIADLAAAARGYAGIVRSLLEA